jgi:hypothetical protein
MNFRVANSLVIPLVEPLQGESTYSRFPGSASCPCLLTLPLAFCLEIQLKDNPRAKKGCFQNFAVNRRAIMTHFGG